MRRILSCVSWILWLTISAIAATGVSPEFKMDLSGMGPWDVRTAAADKAKGRNGCFLWESYVAGLNPEEPMSQFTAKIEMLPDGTMKVTWSPDLRTAEVPRTYTTLGKAKLTDADWTPVTDANKPQMHFFKVKVEAK